jgi:hypothetical protein
MRKLTAAIADPAIASQPGSSAGACTETPARLAEALEARVSANEAPNAGAKETGDAAPVALVR